jgi:hypothetical protein
MSINERTNVNGLLCGAMALGDSMAVHIVLKRGLVDQQRGALPSSNKGLPT